MNVLLLNDAYFLTSLRTLGHKVFLVSPAPGADLQIGLEPVRMRDVLKACPFKPDFVLLSDSINLRAAFLGLEELDFPMVFYGVDSPMNAFWQFDFSRLFDLTFLDQQEPVDRLRSLWPDQKQSIQWLPLGADHRLNKRLPLEKIYDIAFVGTLQPQLRPKRSWILDELKAHFQVAVFDGQNRRSMSPAQVVEIYNQSRLVLNENLFPGMNLRLLEAMSCGACVLTEESDGSWRSSFQDGVHLTTYNSRNLVDKVERLLADESLRQRIADAAMRLVHTRHTVDHRSRTLLRAAFKLLRSGRNHRPADHVYFQGKAFLALASRWPDQPVGKLSTEAVRLLNKEISRGNETAGLHYELGARALSDGKLVEASASLEHALQLDLAHLRSVWALFWCFRESGDNVNAAAELLHHCHHLNLPTNSLSLQKIQNGEELSADDYLFLGEVMEKSGWLFEPGVDRLAGHPCRWNAFDAWQMAISMNPSLIEAYQKCAGVMENGPAPEFALPFLEKLAALQPRNNDVRIRMVATMLNFYRRPEGLRHLQ